MITQTMKALKCTTLGRISQRGSIWKFGRHAYRLNADVDYRNSLMLNNLAPESHAYRLNADVDYRNSLMLNNLAPESQQYTMKASDAIAGHICLSNLSEKRIRNWWPSYCAKALLCRRHSYSIHNTRIILWYTVQYVDRD